ncbi:hypothetical protein K438DRAFT_388161 [Mycena galopus ATCC 62051]|nr:hypothetical protein K438DRAFT_388161 [Mycena galopus ATCC 62051]
MIGFTIVSVVFVFHWLHIVSMASISTFFLVPATYSPTYLISLNSVPLVNIQDPAAAIFLSFVNFVITYQKKKLSLISIHNWNPLHNSSHPHQTAFHCGSTSASSI